MGTNGEASGGNDSSRVMNMILDGLKTLGTKVDANQAKTEAQIDSLNATFRAQMDAGDEKRLSKEVFQEFKETNDIRIKRLEESPMKVLAWLGFACGLIGGPLLSVVLFIVTHR